MTLEEWEEEEKKKAKKEGDDFAVERQRVADDAATQVDAAYSGAIKEAETTYRSASDALVADFRKIYDSNVIDELVLQRSIKERMANLGLSNSGTQKAKQETVQQTRKWADIKTTKSKEEGVAAIMRELDAVRDQYLAEAASQKQQIQQDADADIEKVYADLETQAINRANELYNTYQQGQTALDGLMKPTITFASTEQNESSGTSNAVMEYTPSITAIRADALVKLKNEGMTAAWEYLARRVDEGYLTVGQMNEITQRFGILAPSQQDYYTARAGDGRYEVELTDEELSERAKASKSGTPENDDRAVLDTWLASIDDVRTRASAYFNTKGYAQLDQTLIEDIKSILEQKDTIDAYLRSHKTELVDYTAAVQGFFETISGLVELMHNLEALNEFYSNFANEEEYTTWTEYFEQAKESGNLPLTEEDIAKRRQEIQTRINELKLEQITENSPARTTRSTTLPTTAGPSSMTVTVSEQDAVRSGEKASKGPTVTTVTETTSDTQALLNSVAQIQALEQELKNYDLLDHYRQYMSGAQNDIAWHLITDKGYDAAEDYIDSTGARDRESIAIYDEAAEYAVDNKVAAGALSVANNLFVKPIAFIANSWSLLTGNGIDENSKLNRTAVAGDVMRGAIAEKKGEESETYAWLYENGMSIADFAASYAAGCLVGGSASKKVTLGLMGMQAATTTTLYALQRGMSDGQAYWLGVLAGVIEIGTEKIGLDNLTAKVLGGKKGLASCFAGILSQSLAEASEETVSEIANVLADALIGGERSRWSAYISGYEEDGKAKSEAIALSLMDVAGDAMKAGAGGLFSGAVVGGTFSVAAYASDSKNAERIARVKRTVQDQTATAASQIGKGDNSQSGKLPNALDRLTEASKYSEDSANTREASAATANTTSNAENLKETLTDEITQEPENAEILQDEDIATKELSRDLPDNLTPEQTEFLNNVMDELDTLRAQGYFTPEIDYTAANVKTPTVELKTPSEIAAQVKAAVDGNVPRVIDARNRYEPQKPTMSEAELEALRERIDQSTSGKGPRIIDARNRDVPRKKASGEEILAAFKAGLNGEKYVPKNEQSTENNHTASVKDVSNIETQQNKSAGIKPNNAQTNVVQTGGKHYYPSDPQNKRDVAAAKAYRNISRLNDAKRIAENTGFNENQIRQIKRHIFFEKHKKYDGYGMLDADYDIAVAWIRLQSGKFEPRDITLLKHELLESELEKRYNLTLSEAHRRAKKEFDWEKELIEAVGEGGEADGLL